MTFLRFDSALERIDLTSTIVSSPTCRRTHLIVSSYTRFCGCRSCGAANGCARTEHEWKHFRACKIWTTVPKPKWKVWQEKLYGVLGKFFPLSNGFQRCQFLGSPWTGGQRFALSRLTGPFNSSRRLQFDLISEYKCEANKCSRKSASFKCVFWREMAHKAETLVADHRERGTGTGTSSESPESTQKLVPWHGETTTEAGAMFHGKLFNIFQLFNAKGIPIQILTDIALVRQYGLNVELGLRARNNPLPTRN